MNLKSWALFTVLLKHYQPQANPASLLAYLTPTDAQQPLSKVPIVTNLATLLPSPEGWITNIHYSWLLLILQRQPKSLWPLFIATLPPLQMNRLCTMLKEKPPTFTLAPSIKTFFLQILFNSLQEANILPIEFLLPSSYASLLNMAKEELVTLISYLGIHDLASATKQIVDRKIRDRIDKALSVNKQKFLKLCLHKQAVVLSPKLSLQYWEGGAAEMEKILHQRGLTRLGFALSQESPSFIWAVAHKLDTGRGEQLVKLAAQAHPASVIEALKAQVIELTQVITQTTTSQEAL